jgi:hypothetical protein
MREYWTLGSYSNFGCESVRIIRWKLKSALEQAMKTQKGVEV